MSEVKTNSQSPFLIDFAPADSATLHRHGKEDELLPPALWRLIKTNHALAESRTLRGAGGSCFTHQQFACQ
jgi:hypothetical protein